MATLAGAKAKYARRTANAGAAYNAAKGRAVQNYGSGIARFLGRPAAGHILSAYQAGMSAAEYRGGDPEKWERNYVAKMSGG